MGLAQSTVPDTPKIGVKKYTDSEIRQNIQNLFNNNKMNNFSEASYSIKDLDNVDISDMQENQFNAYQQGGDNIKFKSSKNRHLKHNIDNYIKSLQQGGNPNNDNQSYREISDLSEFQKIKEFLINDANNDQTGGNYDDIDAIINSISSPVNKHKMTLFEAMRGGAAEKSDDDEDDDDLDLEGDDDDDEDEDENSDDEDEDDNDEDSETETDTDTDKNKKNKKKNKADSSEISDTSDATIKDDNFSETSYSNVDVSSGLNIIPFYSSTDSANANEHPYTKNRFN